MTEQEIEKLRDKLGGDYSVKRQNGAITVELVDIWNGVEFAKSNVTGLTFPKCLFENWDKSIQYCTPSSESAYVEQLESKAKELYGEIKHGDEFYIEWHFPLDRIKRILYHEPFTYHKDIDTLMFGGIEIYRQGKWANKIKEPIRVNVYADQSVDGKTQVGMTIKSEFPLNIKSRKEFLNHIEEAIESYLNKIP